jgi:lipopolysaccharide transport system ATP-binding protein
MSKITIRVQGLGKQYRLGTLQTGYKTFRETLMEALKVSSRWRREGLPGPRDGGDKSSRTFWALKDVSFEVKQGEVLGIIGRNGAGKSTLLKILSRITEPTEGKGEIYGRIGSLLEVGTGFHPELTGRENIFLSGAILGMKRDEIKRKFDEIVAFAEVEKFIDTPIKRYSSGMYVRLAFAVAAHLEPEILLVDEVLAVGDMSFQKKCLNKMQDIGQGGRTVLFVSHNMNAITTLCERVILLESGSLTKDGLPLEVVQSYLIRGDRSVSRQGWPESDRPGNQSFRLSSICMKNAARSLVSEINISEKAVLEIEYEVLQDCVRPVLSVTLFDANGYCAFSSLSNTEENVYHGKPLHRGHYLATCELYENLLNNGRYHVTVVGISDYWTDSFRADHVISFNAIEDGKLKRDYSGGYGGTVRPKLRWITEPIEKQFKDCQKKPKDCWTEE